jgi:hypothetical protein
MNARGLGPFYPSKEIDPGQTQLALRNHPRSNLAHRTPTNLHPYSTTGLLQTQLQSEPGLIRSTLEIISLGKLTGLPQSCSCLFLGRALAVGTSSEANIIGCVGGVFLPQPLSVQVVLHRPRAQ